MSTDMNDWFYCPNCQKEQYGCYPFCPECKEDVRDFHDLANDYNWDKPYEIDEGYTGKKEAR